MSANELFNLAIKFCQSGKVDRPIIQRVLELDEEHQAVFLGYVGAWCAGANGRIGKQKK